MGLSETDITENLFKAIDTIIAERLKNLPYDITQIATVVDSSSRNNGIYKVSLDGHSEEFAYSDSPYYQDNDKVILLKSAALSNKIIIGLYMQNNNLNRINRFYQSNSE